MADPVWLTIFGSVMGTIFWICVIFGQGEEDVWVAEFIAIYFTVFVGIVVAHVLYKCKKG